MRKSVLVACSLLVLLTATPALAGENHAFFDMENCSFCSNLTTDATLLPNLGWEHKNIADGMVSVTTYKTPEAEAAYGEARKAMEATGAKMAAGEEVHMCGFCKSMMGLMQVGATHEEVAFEGGSVMLMTSDNPETVKQIHAHCDKINAELKKMNAGMES